MSCNEGVLVLFSFAMIKYPFLPPKYKITPPKNYHHQQKKLNSPKQYKTHIHSHTLTHTYNLQSVIVWKPRQQIPEAEQYIHSQEHKAMNPCCMPVLSSLSVSSACRTQATHTQGRPSYLK